MTPCGQTKLQLPHWMQISGSQTGTNCEMLRFSHFVVPLGIGAVDRQRAHRQLVAAAGHHHRRDLLHELRRLGGHDGAASRCTLVARSGTFTSCRLATV